MFMNKIGIITDSHSGITPQEAKELVLQFFQCHFTVKTHVIMKVYPLREMNFLKKSVKGRQYPLHRLCWEIL
jgi:hypothetical protein